MLKRLLTGVCIGFVLLVVLDAVAVRMGIASGAMPRLPGPSAWMTSRAAGVTAFLALTLDVAFGLFVSTGVVDRWVPRAHSVDIHRWLSSVAITLTALHALVLTLDRFVRFDVLDVIIPFLSSHRSLAVGLGVLAAYGVLVIQLSFGLRRRIGVKAWRKLHYSSFALFGFALIHGVLAGSDSDKAGMQGLYIASGTLVSVLGLYRAVSARARRPVARRSGSAA